MSSLHSYAARQLVEIRRLGQAGLCGATFLLCHVVVDRARDSHLFVRTLPQIPVKEAAWPSILPPGHSASGTGTGKRREMASLNPCRAVYATPQVSTPRRRVPATSDHLRVAPLPARRQRCAGGHAHSAFDACHTSDQTPARYPVDPVDHTVRLRS